MLSSITYLGHGDLQKAADAVEAASTQVGMSCTRQVLGPDELHIRTFQNAPWYKTVIMALPQRVEWQLTVSEGRLRIRSKFRPFGWYIILLVFLCLFVAACMTAALLMTDSSRMPFVPEWLGSAVTWLILPTMLLALGLVRLFGAFGGGRQAEALWPVVVVRMEQEEAFLEPLGRTVSLSYAFPLLTYAGLFLVFGIWLAWASRHEPGPTYPVGLPEILTALAAVAVVLLIGALLMLTRRGFIHRSVPILSGAITTASMLFLISFQLPWWVASTTDAPPFLPFLEIPEIQDSDPELTSGKQRLRDLRIQSPDAMNPALAEALDGFRIACRLAMGFVLFLAVVGLSLALYSVYTSLFSWPHLLRLQRFRAAGDYSSAVRGGALLRLLRAVFVAPWIFFSAFILTTLGLAVFNAFQAAVPVFHDPQLRLAELSAGMIAFAVGRAVDDPVVDVAVRGSWLVYGLAILTCFMISTGQLFAIRRKARRNLRAALRSPRHPRQRELREKLDTLRRPFRLGPVELVVTPSSLLQACATTFGLGRQERFIEMSSECLETFSSEEIEALLAHELAHHLEGHCRQDQLFRWLGRLTLVGDGFVLALQNSWSHEEIADRVAVRKLGVPEPLLARVLRRHRKAQAVVDLDREEALLGLPAFPSDAIKVGASLPDGLSERSFTERWTLAWQLFRVQYFDAMDLCYWHPPFEDREAALLEPEEPPKRR